MPFDRHSNDLKEGDVVHVACRIVGTNPSNKGGNLLVELLPGPEEATTVRQVLAVNSRQCELPPAPPQAAPAEKPIDVPPAVDPPPV